mgnify:CR=1 FL=1
MTPLASERLIAPPLNFCRGAVTWMAVHDARDGEGMANGRKGIKGQLEAMRLATGTPNRDGFNQGHIRDFYRALGVTQDPPIFNRGWKPIRLALEAGHLISLAGNTRGTPHGSLLREHVNEVDHQILLIRIRDGMVRFIDPMTPQVLDDQPKKYARWAPASHIRAFGNRFKDEHRQTYVAERYRPGAWTEDRIRIGRLRERLTGAEVALEGSMERIDELKDQRDTARDKLAIARAELEAADAKGEDLDEAAKAGREQIIASVRDHLDELEAA